MNILTFMKLAIVDGLKVFFPKVSYGIPSVIEERDAYVSDVKAISGEKVPVDFVCKGRCSACQYGGR